MSMEFITGYFDDILDGISERIEAGPPATESIDLSPIQHDYKPTTTADIAIAGVYGPELVRPGIGVKLHHTGGGLQRITVPFHARRYSRGDAEFYMVDMLRRLGRTDLGELCVHNKVYTNCWFVSGEAQLAHARTNDSTDADDPLNRARFHVRGSLSFVRGLPSSPGLPDPTRPPPLERPDNGGFNDGDYKATIIDGPYLNTSTKIGRFCDLVSVSVDRPVLAVPIPRCDGVRIVGRNHTSAGIASQLDYRRGRTIRMVFRGVVWAAKTATGEIDIVPTDTLGRTNPSRAVVERKINDLQYALRGERLKLEGNGNTWNDCYMLSLEPDDDSERYSSLDFTTIFEMDYNEISY